LEHKEGDPIDQTSDEPVALVYRSLEGCSRCSEAVTALLGRDPVSNFSVIYVGPDEELSVQERVKT